jgi:ribosomal protein L34E
MNQRTHWKSLQNNDYIGAYAFQPGEEKTVTISTVGVETVMGAEGRKEDCTVVHFAGDVKPLILNATNSKMIQKVLQTPYIEDWAGKSIVLGVETVAAFGDRVEAVRVRKKQAVAVATDCADCGAAISGSGKFTAAQIAAAAQKRFGRALCLECVEQAKEAAQQEEALNGNE